MFEIGCWPPHARRSIGGEAASLLRTHPRLSAPARGFSALPSSKTQKAKNQC